MYITVKWHIKGKLLLLSGEGIVNYETLSNAIQETRSYMNQTDEPLVHLLIDARNASSEIKSLKDRIEVLRPVFEHPKCGWSILVGQDNPFANFLISTAAQIMKARFRSFKSVQDGMDFLIQVAPSIDDIPPIES